MVTWGKKDNNGGDLTYSDESVTAASGSLTDVTKIFVVSEYYYGAFAALKSDGSVVTWGYSDDGGAQQYYDSNLGDNVDVSSSLTSGVTNIFSNEYAFIAIKSDGSVVTWGNSYSGGNSEAVSSSLNNIDYVISSSGTFAALKLDGSVVTWGSLNYGGDASGTLLFYTGSSSFTNIVKIYVSDNRFIGIRENGTYIIWGDSFLID